MRVRLMIAYCYVTMETTSNAIRAAFVKNTDKTFKYKTNDVLFKQYPLRINKLYRFSN